MRTNKHWQCAVGCFSYQSEFNDIIVYLAFLDDILLLLALLLLTLLFVVVQHMLSVTMDGRHFIVDCLVDEIVFLGQPAAKTMVTHNERALQDSCCSNLNHNRPHTS